MLRQLLRYAALSTALFYNACQPPEEDLESQCEGEVLFEDEFEGSELDEGKWVINTIDKLEGGVLEMRVNGKYPTAYIQSRSTYTLDDRTLCFEARWKVREREGTLFHQSIENSDLQIGSLFATVKGELQCNVGGDDGCFGRNNCNTNVTNYQTYNLNASQNQTRYFINGELRANESNCLVGTSPLNLLLACESEDNTEKRCNIDYVRLTRE